ncbi:MAG: DMT family transporter [Bacteroidales bacterium]|nr:DMT family transporter [Bacteroidales bacterium]MDD3009772.1 DMT family transporter [Bacteroidales bacterium]MDY0285375.1 DMT family transporter [Bacteroidales bacterium]HPE86868.1 DMT family transporter [Bacteroidales bacterium]
MKEKRRWLLFAVLVTLFWGVWGALIEIPEKGGFPATLGFSVWALTMIPCALVAMKRVNFALDRSRKQVLYGMLVGLTGAGGQLALFQALREGPAFIIFPLISLYPIITIILSSLLLRERTSLRGWIGIAIALLAIFCLSWSKPEGTEISGVLWIIFATLVFFAWGIQAFFMKKANNIMRAESIFTYMTFSAVIMIPLALGMTNWEQDINWSFSGPWLTAFIQVLNAIGALMLVYAIRYGKSIIVVPMTSLAPVITIILSLIIYAVFPGPVMIAGMVLAVIAIYLFAE